MSELVYLPFLPLERYRSLTWALLRWLLQLQLPPHLTAICQLHLFRRYICTVPNPNELFGNWLPTVPLGCLLSACFLTRVQYSQRRCGRHNFACAMNTLGSISNHLGSFCTLISIYQPCRCTPVWSLYPRFLGCVIDSVLQGKPCNQILHLALVMDLAYKIDHFTLVFVMCPFFEQKVQSIQNTRDGEKEERGGGLSRWKVYKCSKSTSSNHANNKERPLSMW